MNIFLTGQDNYAVVQSRSGCTFMVRKRCIRNVLRKFSLFVVGVSLK